MIAGCGDTASRAHERIQCSTPGRTGSVKVGKCRRRLRWPKNAGTRDGRSRLSLDNCGLRARVAVKGCPRRVATCSLLAVALCVTAVG